MNIVEEFIKAREATVDRVEAKMTEALDRAAKEVSIPGDLSRISCG